MESHPEIRTEGLVKVYGQRPVVNGVNLRVGAGEIVGLLGPNGAGKTTTLKMVMGLVKPTRGRAEVLGRPVADIEAKRRLGYLPESPYFY